MGNRETVFEMLSALVTGDFDSARKYWHDDAVWHSGGATNTVPYAGDYGPDDYLEMGRRFAADYPDYQADIGEVLEMPPEVVYFHIKSRASAGPHGELDGSGALMVYRVLDGKIAEGWGINARHDRPA